MLKILKNKYPKPATYRDLSNLGSSEQIKEIASFAEAHGLITISLTMYGTREVDTYLIIEKGMGVSGAWDRYRRDLRALGAEDIILTKVK